MSQDIIELFNNTESLTSDFVSGKLAPPAAADAVPSGQQQGQGEMTAEQQQAEMQARLVAEAQQRHLAQLGMPQAQQQQGQGGVPLLAEPVAQPQQMGGGLSTSYQQPIQDAQGEPGGGGGGGRRQVRMSLRMSGLAGGGLSALGRHMSMTSETTFGRAMSGLSALSIDWENMEDFDVNVDHSAGINNDVIQRQKEQDSASGGQSQAAEAAQGAQRGTSPGDSPEGEPTQAELQAILAAGATMGGGGMGPRSSMRRPNVGGGGGGGQMSQQQQQAYNVSFANGM